MRILIKNIKELLQVREADITKISGNDMKLLPTLKNAFLLIENDCIADFGVMNDLNGITADKTLDATGKIVLPSW